MKTRAEFLARWEETLFKELLLSMFAGVDADMQVRRVKGLPARVREILTQQYDFINPPAPLPVNGKAQPQEKR